MDTFAPALAMALTAIALSVYGIGYWAGILGWRPSKAKQDAPENRKYVRGTNIPVFSQYPAPKPTRDSRGRFVGRG